jgi:transcriptional regulator with XRE-family HTH domain
MWDSIQNLIRPLVTDSEEKLPNKFTLGMGRLVKTAREEAGLSQSKLAEFIYRRQATISDIENGKIVASASTLGLLAHVLEKPLVYFFPAPWKPEISTDKLTEEEKELLTQSRRLHDKEIRMLITQVRAIGDAHDREYREAVHEDVIKHKVEQKTKKKAKSRKK